MSYVLSRSGPDLDATFAALADPTRRAILARLSEGEVNVMELAEPFNMSQPAISKHLKVLENAGLITRSREGQKRPAKLEAKPLQQALDYLENYRKYWEASYSQLDKLLDKLKQEPRKASTSHTNRKKKS